MITVHPAALDLARSIYLRTHTLKELDELQAEAVAKVDKILERPDSRFPMCRDFEEFGLLLDVNLESRKRDLHDAPTDLDV